MARASGGAAGPCLHSWAPTKLGSCCRVNGTGRKVGPTSAPLLRRIMKTMKVSNQSCSTMRKQVFRMFHHIFPLSLVMST